MSPRTAAHKQLTDLKHRVARLEAELAALRATQHSAPPNSPAPRGKTVQASLRLPTNIWSEQAQWLSDQCLEYRLEDGSPDKIKILQAARIYAAVLTASNIAAVFNTLKEKSPTATPF